MELLTKDQLKWYGNAKICCICKEKFENKYEKDKKLEIIVIAQGNIEMMRIVCVIWYIVYLKIPTVFHNGSK